MTGLGDNVAVIEHQSASPTAFLAQRAVHRHQAVAAEVVT